MKIQEQIKKGLTSAIKAKDDVKKDTLRVVIGELGRSDKKELSDDEVIKVLRKLLKYEKEVLDKKGDDSDSEYINIIESYLPKMATDEEVKTWIKQNIDFSQFKSKMQAMGSIMKHFSFSADGNAVKKILQEM